MYSSVVKICEFETEDGVTYIIKIYYICIEICIIQMILKWTQICFYQLDGHKQGQVPISY